MKINDWITIWLETYKKPFVKNSTLELIGYCLKHIIIAFDGRNISSVKGFEIQQFLNHLDYIPNMKEKCRKYIGDIFEYAYRNQIINFNPILAVKTKNHDYENTKAFMESERQYFLSCIKGKACELLYTAYLCTGARKSEIIGDNFLEVKPNNILHIKGTKTKYSDRYMPLFDRLSSALELVPNYQLYFQRYKPDYAYLQFVRLCKRIGLEGFCVRSLRSTFSNMCYAAGVREKTISAWLGHSGRSTATRFYISSDMITGSPHGDILREIELVNSIL